MKIIKVSGFILILIRLSLTTAYASDFGCMLKPIQTVEIRSPVVGRISTITVERGSRVTKGQILAKLDTTVEQAAVNSAKYRSQTNAQIIAARNKVNAARKKAKRMRVLFKSKFMSAQALDDANNELEVAQAELNVARESQTQAKLEYERALSELNKRIIKSPLNGTVVARYLDEGAIASPTEGKHPIMSIAQTDKLKIQIIASVKYYSQFEQNSHITIVPEAPFNQPITTEIAMKDKSIDAPSGTFSMIAYISNKDNQLPSGILCKVKQ